MKSNYRITITGRERPKKQKKTTKNLASASIARRYMELRHLRERIAEAEAGRNAR